MIIDFDDKSIVTGVEQFKDKYVVANLPQRIWRAPESTLDLSVPIKIPIQYSCFNDNFNPDPGDLILSRDELQFLESSPDKNAKHSYKTPAGNVTQITMGAADPSQPQHICAILHFRQKTRIGKEMSFRVDLAGTAALIKYVTEYGYWRPTDRSPGEGQIQP